MITKEEKQFIEDTLIEAIDWAEYADTYFQEKHNLAKDQENVNKVIMLLNEQRTCENCIKRYKESNNSYCRIRKRIPVEYQENFSCSEWILNNA